MNLFLSGRARSNVFNDVMELESDTGPALVLKGIDCRQNIGFLSLFEHYQSCQVGCIFLIYICILKLKFRQYPAIRTNCIISDFTI